MLKKYSLLAILCYSVTLTAMQEPMKSEQDQKNWFLYLPDEICNSIANYLSFDDFETEEEFIERTKLFINKPLPENYYQLIDPNSSYFHTLRGEYQSRGFLFALCPNDAKFASLELRHGNNHTPKLSIADVKTKKFLISCNISQGFYERIAISRDTNLLATISAITVSSEFLAHKLTIQKINSPNEEQIIELDPLFRRANSGHAIAFNKQGTHVIIHGSDTERVLYPDFLQHIITPVSLKISKTSPVKKTLKHYFFQQGIFIKDWNCRQVVQ